MFGHRFFGVSFYGPRYFGPGVSVVVPPEVVQMDMHDGIDSHRESRDKRERAELEHREQLTQIVHRAFQEITYGPTPSEQPVPAKVEKQIAATVRAEAKAINLDLGGVDVSLANISRLIREYEAGIREKRKRDNDDALAILLLAM